MKIIFLDIDGVLNCVTSKSRCGVYTGIDDDKVMRLREIVDATGAEIVLSSSWRTDWSKDENYIREEGKYINRKLGNERLSIIDKTCVDCYDRREYEIGRWLEGKDIESFVILDDTKYDWDWRGFTDHWVQTEFYSPDGGLQAEHVAKAIEILNAKETAE